MLEMECLNRPIRISSSSSSSVLLSKRQRAFCSPLSVWSKLRKNEFSLLAAMVHGNDVETTGALLRRLTVNAFKLLLALP
jgi:hypothetical protein